MGLGFSWSTFFVEIVNFLILVWLLTRFFYRPVLRTIASREQHIKDELSRAQQMQATATELTRRYEARLADWEREKMGLRERFEAELATLRATREDELRVSLERERRQAEAAAQMRERDETRRLWQRAAHDASEFAARLLTRFASPALEQRLIAATVEDLDAMPVAGRAALASAVNGNIEATVISRYALDDAQRAAILEAVGKCVGKPPALTYKQDPALVCGVRIELGNATINANVGAELSWFAQIENDAAT